MSLIGDWIRVFKPADTFKTLRNVKNPAIEQANVGLQNDFSTSGKTTASALNDFSSRFLADQPTREAQTSQETGAIDQYYNGDFDRMLAGIRNNRANALRASADRAIGYADRNRKSSMLLQPGGGSSYFDRLALQQTGDIEARTALDAAEQEKADYMAGQNARLGLVGKRQALGDLTDSRLLYPAQVRAQSLSQRLGQLQGITNIDQANTFYGLQKNRSSADKWADIADMTDKTIMTLASAYFGGMGGRAMGAMGGGQASAAAGLGGGAEGYGSIMGQMGQANEAASAGGGGGGFDWMGMAKGMMGSKGGGGSSSSGGYGATPTYWSDGYRAEGGPISGSQRYLVGERGPEMVIPRADGGPIDGPDPSWPAPPQFPGDEPYMVGVNGPEIIQPPRDGTVIPNNQLPPSVRAVMGGGSDGPATPAPTSFRAQRPQLSPEEVKRQRIRDMAQRMMMINAGSNVGPAPTATPSGDSYGGVQAAMTAGNQMQNQQASKLFENMNRIVEQQHSLEKEQQAEQNRRFEWDDQMRHNEAVLNEQKAYHKGTLDMAGEQIKAQKLDHETKQGDAIYKEAMDLTLMGKMTPDLLNRYNMTPDQKARISGIMANVHIDEKDQDMAVSNFVQSFNTKLDNEKKRVATQELAAKKAELTNQTTGLLKGHGFNRDEEKIKQLTSDIAGLESSLKTGEGLPVLTPDRLKPFLDQLGKSAQLSQLSQFDEASQRLIPILKHGRSAPVSSTSSTPSVSITGQSNGAAMTPDDIAGPKYDFNRFGGQAPGEVPVPAQQNQMFKSEFDARTAGFGSGAKVQLWIPEQGRYRTVILE